MSKRADKATEKKPRAARRRPDNWSAEWLKAFLQALPEGEPWSLTAFCKQEAGTGWNRMYQEVVKWRNADKELGDLIRTHAIKLSGRPKKETNPDHANWRVEFVDELLRTGDRAESAKRTPYAIRQIQNFLDKSSPYFDEHFSEMVREAEIKICSEMEGGMIQAFRDADMPRDKAWIARSYLERRDPTRWGKQVELIHSGEIKHGHMHVHALKTREDILIELFEDQRLFLKKEPPKLLSDAPVVEAEWEEVKQHEFA